MAINADDLSQVLNVDGIDLFVEGAGPDTLVMIHGWPDTYRLWDPQVADFKNQYRCVRFTLPGFDIAKPARPTSLVQMVALFRGVVDRVSPDRQVTLMLHDWGCIFGYEFAAKHAHRVARIVGVDIGDYNSSTFLRSLSVKATISIMRYQLWLVLAWWARGSLGNRLTRHMARALDCPTDPDQMGGQMAYPYAMQWVGAYGGLRDAEQVEPRCPFLYVYGARARYVFHSRQWLERLATLPACESRSMQTGHWVMTEQPTEFNTCVADWLVKTRVH